MATLALAYVGSSIIPGMFGLSAAAATGGAFTIFGVSTGISAAALGGTVGGLVGSYIDSTFLLPQVFGQQDIRGPRLDDVRVQIASEGAAINYVIGPQNRVQCQILWMSDLFERKKTSDSGGKGGGGVESTTYTYSMHIAALVCDNQAETHAVRRIWANSELIYDTPDPISITSGDLDKVERYVPGDGSGRVMQIWSKTIDGGPDFEDFEWQDGVDVVVSGFTGGMAGNNGTWKFKKVALQAYTNEVQTLQFTGSPSAGNFRLQVDMGDGAAKTDVIFWDDDAAAIADALTGHPNITSADVLVSGDLTTGLEITFRGEFRGKDVDLLVVTDNNLDDGTLSVIETIKGQKTTSLNLNTGSYSPVTGPIVDTLTIEQTGEPYSIGKIGDVRIYNGSETQNPDPLIEAFEGEGNVPAYRGCTYFILEDLVLTDFGNRPPNLTVELAAHETMTVAEAVAALAARTGDPSTSFDVSGVTEQDFRGYQIAGPQQVTGQLEPLMLAYNVSARERGTALTFYTRGTETIVDIDEEDLGAHPSGSDVPPPLQTIDNGDLELPNSIDVNFIDPDKDYERGNVSEPNGPGTLPERVQVEFPLVMTSEEAREAAIRMLWEPAWTARSFRLTLPPAYIWLEEGDIIRTRGRLMRVVEIDRGQNSMLEIQAIEEERLLAPWDMPGQDGDHDDDKIYTPPDTTLIVLDMPALRDGDTTRPVIYAAIAATNPDASWRGAGLYLRESGGSTDELIADLPLEATVGEALTALPDGPVGYWDLASTLDVLMLEGELVSVTEAECLDGMNRMFVGGELIGFQNAELIETRTYRLSGLLRGLRQTASARASHVAGEACLLLNEGPIETIELSLADIDDQYEFRGVAAEGVVADWPVGATVTFMANSVRPFAPVQIQGEFSGADLHLTWKRCSRALTRVFGPDAAPMVESSELYRIDILDGPGGTVLNSYTSTTASYTYTEAQQIADFGTAQSEVTVIIYQLDSTIVGYPSDEYTATTAP